MGECQESSPNPDKKNKPRTNSFSPPSSTMPASAGSVRMPANNRQTTDSSLQTNAIWAKAIGQTHQAGFGQNEVDDNDGKPGRRRRVPKAVEGSEEYERVAAILRQTKSSRDGTVQDDGRGRWKGKKRLKGLFVAPPMPGSSGMGEGGRKNSEDEGEESWSDSDKSDESGDDEDIDGVVMAAADKGLPPPPRMPPPPGMAPTTGGSIGSITTTTASTREEAVRIYNQELRLLRKEQSKYKEWCKKQSKKQKKKIKKAVKKEKKKEKKRIKKEKKKMKDKEKKKKKRKRAASSSSSSSSSGSGSSSDSDSSSGEEDNGDDEGKKKKKKRKISKK